MSLFLLLRGMSIQEGEFVQTTIASGATRRDPLVASGATKPLVGAPPIGSTR
jgi:hypothetical protein